MPIAIQYQSYSGCSFSIVAGGTALLHFRFPQQRQAFIHGGITVDPSTGVLGGTFYGGGEYTFAAPAYRCCRVFRHSILHIQGQREGSSRLRVPNGSSIWSHRIDSFPLTRPTGDGLFRLRASLSSFLHERWRAHRSDSPDHRSCTQPFVSVTSSQYFATAPIPSYAPVEGGPTMAGFACACDYAGLRWNTGAGI